MGYSLGWNNPLILTVDPNFQRDTLVKNGDTSRWRWWEVLVEFVRHVV